MFKGAPQCEDHYERSCNGRPQSRNQERSVCYREYVENHWFDRLASAESLDSMNDQRSTGDQSHEQKSRTRPAAGECGEETTQGKPLDEVIRPLKKR